MKILVEKPPNYNNIGLAFPLHYGILFTYGDTLYNPDNVRISEDLIVHEETHARQQTEPDLWWGKYLRDPQFRVEQEVEAYANQYNFICRKVQNKQKRFEIVKRMAEILSSPMYGGCINLGAAVLKIKEKANGII